MTKCCTLHIEALAYQFEQPCPHHFKNFFPKQFFFSLDLHFFLENEKQKAHNLPKVTVGPQ